MPNNLAQLLYVVSILLEYGRHLAATIERRAAMPGFALFAALFGTAKLPIILAHLHRGILRATALESLLLRRAATGRDLTVSPPRLRTTPSAPGTNANPDPMNEPLNAQIGRLNAERASHDAPIDPDHLPTREQIEAEVRRRPIGRTITDICRDLGIVPGLCTREFWDSVTEAIACYEGSILNLFDNMLHKTEQYQQAQEEDPESEQSDRAGPLYMHQALGFQLGDPLIELACEMPVPAAPDPVVTNTERHAASVHATGPPPALKLAA
ncbi:MAG TPA: hypothetical protein VMB73_27680 [Acetobacteraceae bacterium]|jgi:hypothetical protein|nr:hypothetical protein [Acetobacteraceae bacterium]